MNTRRKFLLQGSLAGAALLASKPFNAIAGSGYTIAGKEYNHLVFLHTAEQEFPMFSKTSGYIKEIRSGSSCALLLHSGNKHASGFNFDVPPSIERENNDYTIVSKNGLNTGIIFINKQEINTVEKVNRLASVLKNEMNCQMVVCISQLGFKNENSLDDKQLAEASKNIDLIIGGNQTNFTTKTMVIRNSLKHEVILQSSKNQERNCSKIEFSFDNAGFKKHVHIGTRLYKHARND
jgi:hypothetical protein